VTSVVSARIHLSLITCPVLFPSTLAEYRPATCPPLCDVHSIPICMLWVICLRSCFCQDFC